MKYLTKILAQFKQWILSIVKFRCHKITDIGVYESELGNWEIIQNFKDDDFEVSENIYRLAYWKTIKKSEIEITLTEKELLDLIKFLKQFC